ncbi:hypothetical protein [Methylopila capsulata]|nr:hypothetical protein [Methylopila capsulata]
MRVARLAELTDLRKFDGGVRAFLEAHASRRMPTPPETPKSAFDRADAEHAKKLQAMAERGGSENERSVAKRKLEAFAERFGMTGEQGFATCPLTTL